MTLVRYHEIECISHPLIQHIAVLSSTSSTQAELPFLSKQGNGNKCLSCYFKGISLINHGCLQKPWLLTAAWWGFGISHLIYIYKDTNSVGEAGRCALGPLVLSHLISVSCHLCYNSNEKSLWWRGWRISSVES